MKKSKKNKRYFLIFMVANLMLMMFSSGVVADQDEDAAKFCLDGGRSSGLSADGSVFVICVYKYESDFKVYQFTNQNMRVSIKGKGDDLLDCESSTNDSGITICEIDCDVNNRKDRKKRIYELKMLDVNARQYYLSKGKSTNFVEVNESGFSYQFKLKNCKVATKDPFPNNIYILYRSRELDTRLRMRSRN